MPVRRRKQYEEDGGEFPNFGGWDGTTFDPSSVPEPIPDAVVAPAPYVAPAPPPYVAPAPPPYVAPPTVQAPAPQPAP